MHGVSMKTSAGDPMIFQHMTVKAVVVPHLPKLSMSYVVITSCIAYVESFTLGILSLSKTPLNKFKTP